MLLTKFSTSSETVVPYLAEVDRIVSTLLHAVDPPIAYGWVDYIKELLKYDMLYTLKVTDRVTNYYFIFIFWISKSIL